MVKHQLLGVSDHQVTPHNSNRNSLLRRSSQMLLSLLVIWQQCFVESADVSVLTSSGDTVTAAIAPKKLTSRTTYPSVVDKPFLKVVYGTIFNQFGSNMTIVDCVPIGTDQPKDKTKSVDESEINWNTTCLLAPSDKTSTSYHLVVFSIAYLTQDASPIFSWYKSATTFLTLPADKKYFIYPSDSSLFVYIAATEEVAANTQTTLWFVQLKFDGDNKPMTTEKNFTSPGLAVSGLFTLATYSKLTSGFSNAVIIMNTVNSTRDYEGTNAQSSNSKFLVVHLGSGTAYLSSVPYKQSSGTPRELTHLLDLETNSGHVYFVGLDKDGTNPLAAVLGCYKIQANSTQLTFEHDTFASFYPVKLANMNQNKNFFHLVNLRDKNADDDYRILVANHTFDGNANNMQKLTFNLVWYQEIWANDKDIFFMRPAEQNIEIRPGKFGMRNNQMNIWYLYQGKLQYVDLLSSAKLNFTFEGEKLKFLDIFGIIKPGKKPDGPPQIEGLELQRIAASACDKAFSFFNRAVDLNQIMHVTGNGLPLHCLNNNVKLSSWGDQNGSNYKAFATGVYPANQLDNVTTSLVYYDPIPSDSGVFATPETVSCVLERTSPVYYAKLFPKQPEYKYSLTVPRNSNQMLLGVPVDEIIVGSNVSFVPMETYPNVKLLNQKMLPVNIIRTDEGNIVADERWMAGSYIVIEEIRKAIGVLSVNESIDYQSGSMIRKSALLVQLPMNNAQINRARDEIEECDSILILIINKENNTRTMAVFEKTGNKLYKIATTVAPHNQHIMGCSKSSFVFLAWDQNSPTSTLEEFVFNRGTSALVTPPNTPAGFGLKGLANIRKGYMSKVDILFTTWNPGSNILEMQAWRLNDSNPVAPKFELDPRIEYRYLPPSIVGSNPDMSFCHRNYVVFNTDLKQAKAIQGIQSEYFLGSQRNYFLEENVDLEAIGISLLQGIWPHKTKFASSYSAYGIQFVKRPGDQTQTDNFTIIVTFLNGADLKAKVYNVFNSSKVFTTMRATDNNQDKIYFHLKEFTGQTDIYQLSLDPGSQALASFGQVEQSQLVIKLAAKNNQAEFNKIFITVYFQSVSKIEVTPVKDLDYKQDLVLSLLPGMATSVKGSILQIAIQDSNVEVKNHRISGGAESQVPQAMRPAGWVVRENAKVSSVSQFSMDAMLVPQDQTVYISKARSFVASCPMKSNMGATYIHLAEVQTSASKAFVVYREEEGDLKQMVVNLVAKTCSGPEVCRQKKDGDPPIPWDDEKYGDLMVVPIPPIAGLPPVAHLLVLVGKGSSSSYYLYEEAGGKNLYIPLVAADKNPETFEVQPPKAFDDIPHYVADCTLIQEDEVDKNPIMVILCILFEKEIAKGQTVRRLSFLTINLSFAAGGKIYSRHVTNAVPNGDALRQFYQDGVKITHCIFYDKTTISCAAFDAYGAFTQFFLNRQSTCSVPMGYCLTVGDKRYKSILHGSLEGFSGDISKDYVIVSGRRTTSSGPGTAAVTYLYKLGDATTVYYSQALGTIDPKITFISQFFRDNGPPEIGFFLSSHLIYRKYQIGELQLKFTATDRAGLKGTLNFSNADPPSSHYQLKLQDLFKAPIINSTANSAPAAPEKGFFAKYWWACALSGAVLVGVVGFYIYRREMLIRSRARMSDETILGNLGEFHYSKRF